MCDNHRSGKGGGTAAAAAAAEGFEVSVLVQLSLLQRARGRSVNV